MSVSNEYNVFHQAGRWLNGQKRDVEGQRERTALGKFYQHGATLAVITCVGILIGGASVALFLATAGHFSALLTLIKATHLTSQLSHHTLVVISTSGMAGGGTITLVHGSMLGIKKYAHNKDSKGARESLIRSIF